MNTQKIPAEMIQKYAEKGAGKVKMDTEVLQDKGYEIVEGEILKLDGQVRHDPEALARLIFDHYYKVVKLEGIAARK